MRQPSEPERTSPWTIAGIVITAAIFLAGCVFVAGRSMQKLDDQGVAISEVKQDVQTINTRTQHMAEMLSRLTAASATQHAENVP